MGSQEVLRMLRSRWLLIVLAGLLGTSLALTVAAIQKPKYTATADVFVTVTSGQTTGDLAQGGTFSQDQARNFAAVVPKEIVLGPVITQFNLDTTLEDLRKNIDVSVPLNTSLITIDVTDKDPEMAAALANAIANQLSIAVSDLSPKVSDVKGAPVRAQLIEAAIVPDKPSSPNIPLYAMLGMLGGLVLAIGYLVVVELVVARVDSSEQIESLTGSVVLASLPRDRKLARHPIAVTALPLSLRAESVRHARTALKYLPGEGKRTFVVTSSVSGEGKSTTAANLAAAFAAEGLSTCLVEADLRRPRLEGLLDLTGGPGLSDIVVGQSKIEDVVQPWGPDNLQVILVGTVPPNASELLGSTRGREALRSIADRFDVTIIDTPPLTAVTDAAIIGRQFGGVVLVVGSGKLRTSELRQAIGALSVADVPIRGTLMNLAKDDAARPYAYTYADRNRPGTLADLLPKGWRPVIKVAAAVVATAVVATIAVVMATRPGEAIASAGTTPMAAASTPAATQSPRAVFIGDSLVQGTADGSWVTQTAENLGWEPINLGRGGTGYQTSSGKSDCGVDYCPTFVEMVDAAVGQNPDIIVISGGVNDQNKDVGNAAKTLFRRLRASLPNAKILVLSPFMGTNTMATTAAQVKAAAALTGVTYVDIGSPFEGQPNLLSADGITPTSKGYQVLSDTITKALKKAVNQ